MKQWKGQLWRLVLITFLGLAGSIIAGLMIYGGEIFTITSTPFAYYIAYGLSSACIFAFYHVRGLSNTISTAMVVGAILFVGISFLMPILHSAVWSFGVTVSVVVLAFLFERKLAYFQHWKFLVVGLIFGAMFVLLRLFILLVTSAADLTPAEFQKNFLDGLWMGFGLGLGVEVAESLMHSIDLHCEAKHAAKIK
jgi:hypothetical protein